jgi:ATP-dependent DNA helicase RecG
MYLEFLLDPIEKLKGLQGTVAEKLATRIGPRLADFLWHFPLRYEARHWCSSFAEAKPGQKVTLAVHVLSHERHHRQYGVICTDGNEIIHLIYFRGHMGYLPKLLPIGSERLVTGTITVFQGQKRIIHPDHVGTMTEKQKWVGKRAVYPLVAGVTQQQMQTWMRSILERLQPLPEWIPLSLIAQKNWPAWHEAIAFLHGIKETDDIAQARAEKRLAFDELFAHQMALALIRRFHQIQDGIALKGSQHLADSLLKVLPYTLTESQKQVIHAIRKEMHTPKRMISLLMGDVGSGKTIVAIMAALEAIEAGYQVVVLAPTEILATQHFKTFTPLLAPLGIHIGLFVGRNTKKERAFLEEALKTGDMQLAIGTHALLENPVLFHKLGFVIIDEQHRFGVAQRLKLIEKGGQVDVLVMSATPIPRTLLLAYYGELHIHKLTEKPKGRLPITTALLSKNRLHDLYDRLTSVLDKGERVYWICPLIDESETSELGYATERYTHLLSHFGNRVGLLHGKLGAAEKETVMEQFRKGDIGILVATTVVEVGVDVPEATVIVIEHAERFGMAQLHQLRGRVGRGSSPSSAILLYDDPLSDTARKRLLTLRNESDGFKIAEADLKIRGGGDIIGFKQSGMPSFKIANPYVHLDLLEEARHAAQEQMETDPFLLSDKGKTIKFLLSLFGHDTAIETLKGG